jgi:hypothetical protein
VQQDDILIVLEGSLRPEIDIGEMAASEAAVQRGIFGINRAFALGQRKTTEKNLIRFADCRFSLKH